MNGQELAYGERVAIARLHALLELLPTALDKELATTGLTSFEFTLLEALHESDGQRLRLSELASRTNATLARLSRVVTGLERKGFVQRTPCPEDGRATNAVLTGEGRLVYEESRPLYAAAVRAMILDALNPGDVDQLARLSLTILTRLDPNGRLAVTRAPAWADQEAPLVAGLTSTECAADPAREYTARECAADPQQ